MLSTRYSCQILMKLEFSLYIFEKILNIKFCENLSIRSRVFPRGWTEERTNMSYKRGQWQPFENKVKNVEVSQNV